MRRRRLRGFGYAISIVALILAGCGGPQAPAFPAPDSVPAIDPANVESVVFLLGDAGESYLSTSPTLARLQQDVEWWVERLPADTAVALLVLGDVRYPEGVRPVDSAAFPSDTAVVMSQVRTIAGPWAQLRGTRGFFMPGNHDWGYDEAREGYRRLRNLETLLDQARTTLGVDVRLTPPAGTGGPEVFDWGNHFRFLLLDTAWWILDSTPTTRAEELATIEEAMETAGDREILIAGHHPFKSAGSHGGTFSFWKTLGLRYLLHRSGAILEDLTSGPYRELEAGLREVFDRQGSPLVFAGGHDHSLQVIAANRPTDPDFSLVSGSGSKLSGVGPSIDLLYGETLNGYMKIVIENNGNMTLFVEGVPNQFQVCPTSEPRRAECMAEGVAAFRTHYWRELR